MKKEDFSTLTHKKQLESVKSEPVGLIKFIEEDYIEDFSKCNKIYFSNIRDFRDEKVNPQNVNNRLDNQEGYFLYDKEQEPIDITNILDTYFIETYISCFTVLYKDDFEKISNDCKLKDDTIKKLKELENGKERPFVITKYDEFDGFLKRLYYNTPLFSNQKSLIPKNYEKSVISKIHEVICPKNVKSFYDHINNIEFSFHGGLVLYEDDYNPLNEEEIEILNDYYNSKVSKKSLEIEEHKIKELSKKIIEAAITNKSCHYQNENEYRVLINSFFNHEKSRIIKQGLTLIPSEYKSEEFFKYYKFNDLEKITISSFNFTFEKLEEKIRSDEQINHS